MERNWLCYSTIYGGVYCEPCWLFADRNAQYFQNSWCTGKIIDWKGLSKKIKEHEESKIHMNACVTYSHRKGKECIGSLLYEKNMRWKEILRRILDVILTLSRCNLPFRGHRENIQKIDIKSGNFLNIIDLLSRYDPLLKSHIENQATKTKYFSPLIQNELIQLSSTHLLNNMFSEIKTSPFFSLILDTTQDLSKTDQMSIVLRYVTVQLGENIKINESFLGFVELKSQTANDLYKYI